MFIACAARHAAIETCKSSSRVRPPETDVNAPTNPGSQDMTSTITSGSPIRGSITPTSLRSSVRLGGSGIASSAER